MAAAAVRAPSTCSTSAAGPARPRVKRRVPPSTATRSASTSSRTMLERARERAVAEGLTNVEFVQADAQVHAFTPGSVDVVLSRMGAMFFADPVAAFANIAAATRPGGRMVLLTWQELARNEWVGAVRGAFALGRTLPAPPRGAPGPFGLSDPDHVRSTLEAAGWRDVELDDVQVPFRAGADADDAYAFVAGIGHRAGPGAGSRRRPATRRRSTRCAPLSTRTTRGTDAGVVFGSAAWIINAARAP